MSKDSLAEIFKAYDIRGKVGSQLTPETVERIGAVFGDWLPTEGVVAVGHDMRPDSAELAQALIKGITVTGRDVMDVGQVTSDMSYFAVGKYNLAGAAMVTASHNPGADNGIKLYRDQVIAVGLDAGLDQIRDRVLTDYAPKTAAQPGQVTAKDITEDWLAHVMSFVPDPAKLKPYKMAVDAGNGMAGKIFPELEPYVPFEVTELYFDLDGTFPNHEANPQKPENMQDLIKTVQENKLDFGIAFDGDGDRAGFVDDKGRIVSGSDLISIVAREYLKKYPGAEIVHEVRTSRATQELVREWGGTPFRTKAGRVSIGTVMREHDAPFGGETTGHLFFKENYYADSGLIGAMMVIVALQAAGKKLSQLVDEYHRYATMPEVNFEVADKDGALKRLAQAFSNDTQDTLDGLTVNFDDGWFNIRASNTEPVMRLNAEAGTQARLDELVAKVTHLIQD
ncbi:MAG TPA: phosphomannomutase/phosphoglucomutase [Candidatus Limnocylindria bacterium]|nr:phosphomannomutase/phosphoglucomutase [Candidatus Limnocylindria bacterium]